MARSLDEGVPGQHVREALDGYGSVVPWDEQVLSERARCYERLHDPRLGDARRDLEAFQANAGSRLKLAPRLGG